VHAGTVDEVRAAVRAALERRGSTLVNVRLMGTEIRELHRLIRGFGGSGDVRPIEHTIR
jgi:hypothetical protein